MDLNSRQYVVSLDMTRTGSIRESFEMRHNDDNELIIELRDSDGIIDLNASGVLNATLLVTRKDKVDIPLAGTITPEGRASFKLKRASLEKQGMVEVVAQFYFANDVRISTPTLIFNVLRDPSAGAVGDEGDDRTLIEIILNDAPALLEQLQTAYDELVIQKAAFAQFQSDSETAFSNAQNQRSTDFNADQAARSTAFEDAQTQRATDFNTSQGERTTLFDQAQTNRQNDYQTWKDAKETELNQLASDTENSKLAADGATANANNAATEALEAAEEATGAVAEVTGAKQSTVKSKTFVNLDARMEELEGDTFLPMKNEVVNGDFSQGLNGWSRKLSPSPGTIESLDTLVFSSSPQSVKLTQNANNVYYVWDIPATLNDKIFVSSKVKRNTTSGQFALWLFDYGANTNIENVFTFPNEDKWAQHSVITKSRVNGVGISLGNGSATTGVVNFDDVITINLTKTFGKGNEPTKEEMDRLLAKYPNSFFDGTVNLTSKLLDDLRYLTSDVQMPTKNEIVNGDFSQGTTGWNVYAGSSLSSNLNTLIVTGSSSFTTPGVRQTSLSLTSDGLIYVRARARVTNAISTQLRLRVYNPTQDISVENPIQNQWYTLSDIKTKTSTSYIEFTHTYADTAQANGAVMEVKDVIVIDLTKIFGAGNEPTKAQMDALLATYPNSWFDGTVNLAENKRIIPFLLKRLELKADKTQESKITPTLLNGWAQNISMANVRFFKDSLGFVHLEGGLQGGTIGAAAFNLPVGYRPTQTTYFPAISQNGIGEVSINSNGNVNLFKGNNTWYSLSGIYFYAGL